ncbi:hypothetical protein [Mycobacterium sp. SMC-19]|uniref:hypothetical protein n=1 Tax=Mycobacterium sp. SMC-19 TaxID=3381630 RepID=UPI003877114C
MKLVLSLAIPLVTALAFGASSDPAEAKPDAPQDPALIARFTNVIWPTILNYRHYGQGDPQSPPGPGSDMAKFNSVVDVANQTGAVKIEAQGIGELLNTRGVSTGETDHIALAVATISSLAAGDARVIACYTYDFTARSEWPHTNDHPVPGASEVTFTLHKDDDWLVRKISNDHAVPGCGTAD